jgi:hypothetical protein
MVQKILNISGDCLVLGRVPSAGSQDRNIYHTVMELIKFVVVDGNTYINFDMLHNNTTNNTKDIFIEFPRL